jgi:hypothetical protein
VEYIQMATKESLDLIELATHGRTNWDDALLVGLRKRECGDRSIRLTIPLAKRLPKKEIGSEENKKILLAQRVR